MSSGTPVVAELVPIADRVRWMLGCRVLLALVLFVVWYASTGGGTPVPAVAWLGLFWVAFSAGLSVPVIRPAGREGSGRWLAVVGFTIGLLGDALLLAGAYYNFGGLTGPIGYLVILHGVAVTLLASFRTGAKLALWHSILALVVIEAVGAGVVHPRPGVELTSAQLSMYLTILWASVLATASFAAINERELRRRRYDSEMLRQFGLGLTDEQEPDAISLLLARFARDELLASRAVVLVQVRDDDAGTRSGHAVVVRGPADGTPELARITGDPMGEGVLGHALDDRTTVLVSRLDAHRDAWLSGVLPDAHNLVIVPFAIDQISGAVVVEHPKRSTQRRSQRAERRTVSTTEQATAHASMAIGRAILMERIRAAAEVDGLTQVANRRRFDTVLAQSITAGSPFALVMVDLDHFKQLNDRYGHQAGDDALRAAAACLAANVREGDLAARYGGEEFAMILLGVDASTAAAIADRIRRAIAAADTGVPVTASLGVAAYPAHSETGNGLLAAADAALYAAKESGRNRVSIAGTTAVRVTADI